MSGVMNGDVQFTSNCSFNSYRSRSPVMSGPSSETSARNVIKDSEGPFNEETWKHKVEGNAQNESHL